MRWFKKHSLSLRIVSKKIFITLKSATTTSTKEEILINNSGVFVVVINGKSFKIAL